MKIHQRVFTSDDVAYFSGYLTPEAQSIAVFRVEFTRADDIAHGEGGGYALSVVNLWCTALDLAICTYPLEAFSLWVLDPNGDLKIGKLRFRFEEFTTRQVFRLLELNEDWGERVVICPPEAEARFGVNRADLVLFTVRFGLGLISRPSWLTSFEDELRRQGVTLTTCQEGCLPASWGPWV